MFLHFMISIKVFLNSMSITYTDIDMDNNGTLEIPQSTGNVKEYPVFSECAVKS